MATPPPISSFDINDLDRDDWKERLSRTLNQVIGPSSAALSNGLTFTENMAAQWHTTSFVNIRPDWVIATSLVSGFQPWYESAYETYPQYRKGDDGRVEISGLVKAPNPLPSGAVPIFALPREYQPDKIKGPFITGAASTPTDIHVEATGNVIYRSGGAADGHVNLSFSFMAADRTPISNLNYSFITPFNSRPKGVLITECRDKDNAVVACGNPSWDFISATGRPSIKVAHVPGLAPERNYRLTFLVLWK